MKQILLGLSATILISCVDYRLQSRETIVTRVAKIGDEDCVCIGTFKDSRIEFPCDCSIQVGDTIIIAKK